MWQVKLPTCHCNDLYYVVGLLSPVLQCTYDLVYDLILYEMIVFLVNFSFLLFIFYCFLPFIWIELE